MPFVDLSRLEFIKFLTYILVCEFMFSLNYRRREKFLFRCVLTVIAEYAACTLYSLFNFAVRDQLTGIAGAVFSIFSYCVIFAFSIVGLKVIYSESLWSDMMCGLTAYAFQHISYNLYAIAFSLLFTSGAVQLTLGNIGIFQFVQNISDIIVFVLIYFLVAKNLKKYPPTGSLRMESLSLSVGVLFVALVLNAVRNEYVEESMALDVVCRMFSIVCCVCIIFLRTDIFVKNALERENEIISQLRKKEQAQYELKRDTTGLINMKCHDLKYLLRDGELKGNIFSTSELEEIKKSVDIISSDVDTGNETLDMVVSEWSRYCSSNGVEFTCIANAGNMRFMSDIDIYTLFGNAIENAARAAAAIPEREKRVVNLSVGERKGMLYIEVVNSCLENVEFLDGLPVTTKADKENHGFGIKSMKRIADKYGGELYIDVKDKVFRLSLLLPMT